MTEEVEQIQWFDDRYYRRIIPDRDGEKELFYPSSTTILGIINKPFLDRWRADVGNWEADRRLIEGENRGRRIHAAINIALTSDSKTLHYLDENGNQRFSQEEWLHIIRFQEWFKVFKPKIHFSELKVFDDTFEYAGTCDLLMELQQGEYQITPRIKVTIPETGLYIGDIKTGKVVDEDYHFQTASYAQAVESMGVGIPIGTMIIHTQADNNAGWKVYLRDRGEMLEDKNMFIYAMNLWKRKNPNATPKVFTMPEQITLTLEA